MLNDNFFFLYLDEIYTPSLKELQKTSKKDLENREQFHHFGIGGAIIPANELVNLNFAVRKIQNKFYPNKHFHHVLYVDILNKRDLYSDLAINAEKCHKLTGAIERLVTNACFGAVYCFINKEKLILKYGNSDSSSYPTYLRKIRGNIFPKTKIADYNLYFLSLRFLLERYHLFLTRKSGRGVIVAESRGDKEDLQLRDAFDSILRNGVGKISATDLRSKISDIFIVHKKQNHAGLQLADAIIYPTYDGFVPGHNTRTDHFISFVNAIKPKLYKGDDSIKVFPE
ncbi:MAG: DUF3800 domain-containing protein [Candidatus Shapirobacteria bacterium]